jgi:hypothetical protein
MSNYFNLEAPFMTRHGTLGLPTNAMPLQQILAAVADEFAQLQHVADEMQAVLSPALLSIAHDPECLRHVQALDRFSQSLEALAMFVDTLSRTVPPTCCVDIEDAARVIKLAELAQRLAGAVHREPEHDAGVVDFF